MLMVQKKWVRLYDSYVDAVYYTGKVMNDPLNSVFTTTDPQMTLCYHTDNRVG
jgi:hypothetical protein